jgi:cytochrome P450
MDVETPERTAAPAITRLRRYDDLPGPRPYPVVGNALQLDSRTSHLQMQRWCDEYGPIYRLRIGPRRVMVIGDHALVARVLRDRPDGFRRTSGWKRSGRGDGPAAGPVRANGEVWKRQRRMVMARLRPGPCAALLPVALQAWQRLVGAGRRPRSRAQTIDLQADLMRYTVDTIAGLAFGAEVNTLETDDDVIQHHLDKIFPALGRGMLSPLPIWRWWRSAADRELERSVVEVNKAVDGFIAQARARLAADPSPACARRTCWRPCSPPPTSPAAASTTSQVAGNVLTMLLAGEDTTANTIAWMIHLLWHHPAALARATAEVRACRGGDPARPTWDEMAQLDFIEACCHETMRLKPVAPLLPLQALADTTLADVQVPKGMVVIDGDAARQRQRRACTARRRL